MHNHFYGMTPKIVLLCFPQMVKKKQLIPQGLELSTSCHCCLIIINIIVIFLVIFLNICLFGLLYKVINVQCYLSNLYRFLVSSYCIQRWLMQYHFVMCYS